MTITMIMASGNRVIMTATWELTEAQYREQLTIRHITPEQFEAHMQRLTQRLACGKEAAATFVTLGGQIQYSYVSSGVTGPTIVKAFPWDTAPGYLVRDNDGAYGQVFRRRVRSMGIRDRPISPRSPWQNAYAERVIGTLRRDCLDHVLIFSERHLRRTLTAYFSYYNETSTHLSLDKDTPISRAVQRCGLSWLRRSISNLGSL